MDTILLVEEDTDLRRVVAASLEQQGWHVLTASTPDDAEAFLGQEGPSILVFGAEKSWNASGDFIHLFREEAASADRESVVVITPTDRLAEQWRTQNMPDVVIYKPYDIRYLNRCIESVALTQGGKTEAS